MILEKMALQRKMKRKEEVAQLIKME